MLNIELGKNYFWLSKTSNICFHWPKQGKTPETSQINPMLMCRLDFRLFSRPGIVVNHVNKNILTRQERYKSYPHGQRTTHLFLIASNFSGSSTTTLTPRCILAFWRLKSRQAILAFSTRLGMAENKKPQHIIIPKSPPNSSSFNYLIQGVISTYVKVYKDTIHIGNNI